MTVPMSVYIGFDQREVPAFAAAALSLRALSSQHYPVHGVVLDILREQGLYTRPTETKIGKWEGADGKKWASSEPVLWDTISQWTMSTEFAVSRFLTLELARREAIKRDRARPSGWAMFIDCDVLFRADVAELHAIAGADTEHALLCVQHDYQPSGAVKMDGQIQSAYPRKNWSSVMMFRLDHSANEALTAEAVNTWRGADLHAFKWLADEHIGVLPAEWNWLEGETQPKVEPKLVHYTRGGPWMKGFENVAYADEWRYWLNRWAERTPAAA